MRGVPAWVQSRTLAQVATVATWLSLTAIVGFGGWLRFRDLGRKSLLGDEIITANRALEYELSNTFPHELTHRFIAYTYSHYLMEWFGQNEVSLRIGPAILGTLGLIAVFLLARALFDRLTAIVSTFLLSIAVFHLDHSQVARFYPGLALFSLLAFFALVRAVETNRKRYWVLFVVATALNLYNHLFAVLVLGACAMWGIGVLVLRCIRATDWEQRKGNLIRFAWLVAAGFAIIIIYLPALANLADTLRGVGDVAVGGAEDQAGEDDGGGDQRRLGGHAREQERLDLAFEFERMLVQFRIGTGTTRVFHASLFALGVAFLFARRQWGAITLFGAAPLVALLFLVLVVTEHFFLPKYVIYLLPLYLITIAYGAVQSGRLVARSLNGVAAAHPAVSPLSTLLVALAIVASIVAVNWSELPDYYAYTRSRDPRGAAAYIHHQQQPNDGIVVLWGTQFGPYNFYHTKVRGREIGENHGDIYIARTIEGLERFSEDYDRIWLVADKRSLSWASPELYRWVLQDSFMIPFNNYPIYLKQENLHDLALDDRIALLEEARRFTDGTYNNDIPIAIGDIYASKGDVAEAMAMYRDAREARPYKAISRMRMARLHEDRREWESAAAVYGRLIDEHPNEYDYEISLGHKLVEIGHPNEAAEAYHRAGQAAGSVAVELIGLGDAALTYGNVDRAAEIFTQAVEEDPENQEAWSYLALARVLAGDEDAAQAAYDRALELPLLEANVALRLTRVDLLQGRFEAAERMALQAIELALILPEEDIDDIHELQRPTVPYAVIVGTLLLGDIAKSAGDMEAAEEHYREAAAWLPFDPIPVSRIGLLHSGVQDFEAALTAFREAQALAPASTDDIEREARTLEQLGRPAEALEVYARLLQVAPNNARYRVDYANLLSSLERPDDAEAEYRAIIEEAEASASHASFIATSSSPTVREKREAYAQAYAGLADIIRDRALENGKSIDEAMRLYARGLEFNPDEPMIYLGRSVAYEETSRLDLALAEYEKAVAVANPAPSLYSGLGELYEQHGRMEDAEAAYRSALELVPDSYPAHIRLGQLLLDIGKPADAEEVLRDAVNLEPDRVAGYKRLGDLFLDEGFPSEALAFYNRAITHNPSHVPTLVALGDLYRNHGDLTQARVWYERAVEADPDSNRVERRLQDIE